MKSKKMKMYFCTICGGAFCADELVNECCPYCSNTELEIVPDEITKGAEMQEMTIEQIAEVAHETNRAYCQTQGGFSQLRWRNAPDWQKESAIKGVQFHIDNPDASCSASHDEWLKEKALTGWKYGPTKDPMKREHPCFVPYDELPLREQVKDTLFVGVVRALKKLLN